MQDRRMSAFRATDAFAVEAFRACRSMTGAAADGLAREIRRTAVRSGGALVAASGSPHGGADERASLERARSALVESRYYLSLARRFGLLDVRSYRTLTARQDVALRELSGLLGVDRAARAVGAAGERGPALAGAREGRYLESRETR